ncbi:MAG: FAD-dependent oxidoreductase [Actinomycetota bacterium]
MNLWWTLTERPHFSPTELFQKWDVVIVGGGFTGLWTAHHLISSNPRLKIAVLEKDRVGSGASGRNGGWISALYPVTKERTELLDAHLIQSIDEIGDFVSQAKIDCGFIKGGSLSIARNYGQLRRLQKESHDVLLSSKETRERVNFEGALGATFTPHCARINPAQLVVGLAQSLASRGVQIFENTPAEISFNKTVTVNGNLVNADFVVRAIEAYHSQSRDQIPIYSLIVATDPLRLPLSMKLESRISKHSPKLHTSLLMPKELRIIDC